MLTRVFRGSFRSSSRVYFLATCTTAEDIYDDTVAWVEDAFRTLPKPRQVTSLTVPDEADPPLARILPLRAVGLVTSLAEARCSRFALVLSTMFDLDHEQNRGDRVPQSSQTARFELANHSQHEQINHPTSALCSTQVREK
jgi:hypothetical protein